MLTEKEKAKIIEEERIRVEFRRQHYRKSGLRYFLLRAVLFLLIYGGFFLGVSIAVSVGSLIIGIPYPVYTPLIALIIGLIAAIVLIKRIKS